MIALTDCSISPGETGSRQPYDWSHSDQYTHDSNLVSTGTLGRAAAMGAGAGVLASIAMAMYAMLASWAKDTGFFTPLYHIASLIISDHTMMVSMEDGMGNSAFHFAFGPALLGAVIHMMTGAMYGDAVHRGEPHLLPPHPIEALFILKGGRVRIFRAPPSFAVS